LDPFELLPEEIPEKQKRQMKLGGLGPADRQFQPVTFIKPLAKESLLIPQSGNDLRGWVERNEETETGKPPSHSATPPTSLKLDAVPLHIPEFRIQELQEFRS